MKSINEVVYGIYPSQAAIENAVVELRDNFFRNTDVAALFSKDGTLKEFGHKKSTKSPEGASVGGTIGLFLGATLGWIAGSGFIDSPSMASFIAAGPVISSMAGIGVVGFFGALVGSLVGMGIPEYEALRFEGIIKDGGLLLSVHCDSTDWVEKAKDILERTGATGIASTSEAHSEIPVDEHNLILRKSA